MNREKVRLSANEQLGESMDRISSLINKSSQYGKSINDVISPSMIMVLRYPNQTCLI